MTKESITLYLLTFVSALVISLILTPAARAAALVLDIHDHPHSDVKTHKEPVPYLGGVAIFLAFTLSLLWIRVLTSFPTGTLHSLRGILTGGFFVFLLGLADDIKQKGLHYRTKFSFQILAASLVMLFGIQIKFIQPSWFAILLSLLWIVGITNACNIIDIMDGLASGVIFLASLAFLFIAIPTEAIYVNFAAAALGGATLGFLPFNVSRKMRIFMGDSGSLFIGFVAGSLALGTSYTGPTDWTVLTPLLILAVPIYDTTLVFWLRIKRGMSPFLGSKDHFPLRLEKLGWSRRSILIFTLCSAVFLSGGAYGVTKSSTPTAISFYCLVLILLGIFTSYILKAKVE